MTREQLIRAANRELKLWSDRLGLGFWRVSLDFASLPDGRKGQTGTLISYYEANIVVDLDQHHSAEDIGETIRHELIHVLLANLDIVPVLLKEFEDDPKIPLLRRSFEIALEQVTTKLELILRDLANG